VVAGAKYAVYAAEDVYTLDGTLRYREGEKVDTLRTNKAGKALSEELYLGSYSIKEVATPNGYALNPTAYPVNLVYKGQTATVNIEEVEATNVPTTLKIAKVDAATGEPLAGVAFAVEDGQGNIEKTVTGADGYAEFPYLLRGDYSICETATVPGYILSEEVWEISVDDNGLIEGQAVFEIVIANDFTKLEVIKTDAATGKPLAGAKLQIVDADGNVIHEWASTDKPYLIERIAQGQYTLREVSAPVGYELAKDVKFTVEDTAQLQRITIKNTAKPASGKLDQTGREVKIPYVLIGVLAIVAVGGIAYVIRNLRAPRAKKDVAHGQDCE
jgi:uncharacterized surface anchored protein